MLSKKINLYKKRRCPFAEKCKKISHNKKLYVADNFLRYRKQSQENITTEKGIILRMNRSIQVEGAFGVLKQNMKFKRFKYREKSKTKVEVILFAIGYNLRKYVHKKIKAELKILIILRQPLLYKFQVIILPC
ncbi:transposase [Leptotrichia sp. HSP-342]|uniref:Transposase n=1 Tax=Leptotrichia mesophila TaxID=3239303 RepID=A0AB39VCY9_9FUSO